MVYLNGIHLLLQIIDLIHHLNKPMRKSLRNQAFLLWPNSQIVELV